MINIFEFDKELLNKFSMDNIDIELYIIYRRCVFASYEVRVTGNNETIFLIVDNLLNLRKIQHRLEIPFIKKNDGLGEVPYNSYIQFIKKDKILSEFIC